MDKQKCRGHKENSDSEQKLANQNDSFPLCLVRFYLSIEAQFLRFINFFSFQEKKNKNIDNETLIMFLNFKCVLFWNEMFFEISTSKLIFVEFCSQNTGTGLIPFQILSASTLEGGGVVYFDNMRPSQMHRHNYFSLSKVKNISRLLHSTTYSIRICIVSFVPTQSFLKSRVSGRSLFRSETSLKNLRENLGVEN